MGAIFRTTRKRTAQLCPVHVRAGAVQPVPEFLWTGFHDRYGDIRSYRGVIFLDTRIFDAVNDPVFGGIMDRAHLKSGKFIPWLRLATLLLPLFTLLLFFLPAGLPVDGKIAWAAVFYVLYSVAYTICDVPIYSMVSATTDQLQERVHIQSRNSLASSVSMLLMMVVVPLLYPNIGWAFTAVLIALPAVLLMLPMTRNAKERYVETNPEPVTLKTMFLYVRNNRYLLLFFAGLLVLNATSTIMPSAVYFASYNLGNPELTGVLSAIVAAPTIVFAAILPSLTKRFDKFHIFLACVVGQLALSVLSFAAGYGNFALFCCILALRGVCFGGISILMLMFTSDLIEYGQFKTGKRMQGTANSIQTFVCKVMTALNGALTMFVLAASGFQSGAGAVQTDTTLSSIWMLISLVPGIGALLSLFIFRQYKLRDKDVQLMARVNTGEMDRQEAEKQFTMPY